MMKRLSDIFLIYIPSAFLLISLSLVLAYRWLPVKWTPLMLIRSIENRDTKGYENKQNWVSIESIDPVLIEAILTAEDQRFYGHNGFDFVELMKMKAAHEKNGSKIRGCSTISQQVAKNCFTFCSRTWARKALEAYYTVLIEMFWGKERILEVYLNVIETGRGLFGVEAVCQRYYQCSSSNLTVEEAAAIACILPKPLARTPYTVLTTHASKHKMLTRTVLKAMEETTLRTFTK